MEIEGECCFDLEGEIEGNRGRMLFRLRGGNRGKLRENVVKT